LGFVEGRCTTALQRKTTNRRPTFHQPDCYRADVENLTGIHICTAVVSLVERWSKVDYFSPMRDSG
jgi:hypothetical protein